MKWIALGVAAFLLAGCEHYIDMSARSFNRGAASQDQFAKDNAGCQQKAMAAREQAGGNGDPHGIYNAAYRACMEGIGYHPSAPSGFGGW